MSDNLEHDKQSIEQLIDMDEADFFMFALNLALEKPNNAPIVRRLH